MNGVLNVSDAASLALHSMVTLSDRPGEPMTTREIAAGLEISEAHLSKVLQRLARCGLVRSIRGPKGGFVLGKPPDEIALLDVYEAIDGPMTAGVCLLGAPVCRRGQCIFGDLLARLTGEAREYLSTTYLAALARLDQN